MKKYIALTLAAVTAAAAVAGCSSGSSSTTENKNESAGNTSEEGTSAGGANEITSKDLVILYSGSPEIQEKEYLVNKYFKGFEEEYGVTVTVDFVTQADGITKIQTEQETGNVIYDVVYADTANIASYVNGGWMADISEVVKGTGSTYTTMFDDVLTKDGERYFVPNSYDVYVLIANVKALDYLPEGLTREDVESGITWEQYAEWAVAIAEGEGEGKTMMPASLTSSQLLYPMGGMSLAYGGGFPEFTSDGFKGAMNIIARMAEGNAFYSEQDQYTAVTEPMNSGDVWLAFSHMTPASSTYNTAPNSFVIGAAPSGSAGAGSTSGAWCYGIQKGASHQDLAQAFIEYIARPEVNYDFCSNLGVLSTIEEVGDVVSDDDVVIKAGLQILDTAIVAGVPSTEYTDWNAVKILYGDIFNEVLNTKAVPTDDYLAGKQAELEALKISE